MEPVVVSHSRVLSLVAGGLFGLLGVSLVRYLLGDEAEGGPVGWALAWALAGFFVVSAVLLVRAAFSGDRVELDEQGLVRVRRGERTRTTVGELGRLTLTPGEGTTWTGPARPGEPRLLSRSRLDTRLRITGPGVDVALTTRQPCWGAAVAVVGSWVRERPDLAADETTRRFFAGLAEPAQPRDGQVAAPRTSRGVWVAVAVVWVAATLALVAVATAVGDALPPLSASVGFAVGGALLTGALVYPVVTTVPVARALVRALGGDAWWLFRPDRDGRYSWLVSGRMSALQASRGGGAVGLTVRWVVVALLWLTSFLPLLFLAYVAGVVVELVA